MTTMTRDLGALIMTYRKKAEADALTEKESTDAERAEARRRASCFTAERRMGEIVQLLQLLQVYQGVGRTDAV